jgi:hypothetical protein
LKDYMIIVSLMTGSLDLKTNCKSKSILYAVFSDAVGAQTFVGWSRSSKRHVKADAASQASKLPGLGTYLIVIRYMIIIRL